MSTTRDQDNHDSSKPSTEIPVAGKAIPLRVDDGGRDDGGGGGPLPTKAEVTLNVAAPTNGTTFSGPAGMVPIPVTAEAWASLNGRAVPPSVVRVKVGNGDYQPLARGTGAIWSGTVYAAVEGSSIELRIEAALFFEDHEVGERVTRKEVVRQVSIRFVPDAAAPDLTVSSPENNKLFEVASLPFHVTMSGATVDPPSGNQTVSGVQQVEYSLNGGKFATIIPDTGGNWTVTLKLNAFKRYEVHIRARDRAGNYSTTKSIAFTLVDKAPALDITTELEPTDQFSSTSDKVIIRLEGTARDPISGIKSVQWSLDGTTFSAEGLTMKSDGLWGVDISVPMPSLGEGPVTRSIKIRCTDNAGDQTVKEVVFKLRRIFKAADPFSQIAYLSALIDYATEKIRVTSRPDVPIKPLDLSRTFHQPFSELLGPPATVTSEPLHQVRLSIEILRDYLAKRNLSAPGGAEQHYCRTAYSVLLQQLGTSYDELRLIRGADDDARSKDARSKLANRLGISEQALDGLFLPLEQITEQHLQQLFGLAQTQPSDLKVSLATTLANSQFLAWQKEHLRALWVEQDYVPPDKFDTPPILDPDVVQKNELRGPSVGTWTARRQWLDERDRELKQARAGKPALDGYKAILKQTWPDKTNPDADLMALDAKGRGGERIDADLDKTWGLTASALTYLMKARSLAATGTILDAEWNEVDAILVQVQKQQRRYPLWHEQENKWKRTLGPEFFQLDPAVPPQLPAWRASAARRRAWEQTLQARTAQLQSLEQALQAAVNAAEEAALPGLRDALCEAAQGNTPASIDDDELTRRLLIDVRVSGALRTTRIRQAIEALQAMLFGLRTGRLLNVPWTLTGADTGKFDVDWQWMGSDETWRAAMQVFHYPERLLLPSLRSSTDFDNPTEAFKTLISELRRRPCLTRKQAQEQADVYLTAVKEKIPDGPLKQFVEATTFSITEKLDQLFDRAQKPIIRWDLKERADKVKEFFGETTNPHDASVYIKELFYFVPMALALQLQQAGEYIAALDWFQTIYAYHLPKDKRKIYYGLTLESNVTTTYQHEGDWLQSLNPHGIACQRTNAYTRFTIMSLARCFVEFADAEFTRATDESLPRARALYMNALDLLGVEEMKPKAVADAPPDPHIEALRQHAAVNLSKLRNGRNIAGMRLQIALDPDEQALSAAAPLRPTPYRYTVLIERAKNLVTLAQQMEGAYLAALEKTDAESYNLLRARHELGLAGAGVELQRLRVDEAIHGESLAALQSDRAQVQYETYDQWLNSGLSATEKQALAAMQQSIRFYDEAGQNAVRAAEQGAILGAMSGALTGMQAGGGGGAFGLHGAVIGAIAGAGSAYHGGESQRASSAAAAAATRSSILSMQASQELRIKEWTLQKSLAERDMAMARQQITLADDHTKIVKQEQAIAQLQQEHARAVVDFLANKFTNAELYAFMAGVLGGVYRYFLQQATATAQLAQSQLAFERQQRVPSFVQDDYWQPPASSTTGSATSDRRGLTGSARLLQDIYQLDQHAFDTNKRKLQLAQTFSLARLAPLEFQRFRETGVLPFSTPMELYDRGFPGHYLRLIKRVKVSVVALIPPTQGIRATLVNNGISRVVIGGDRFQPTLVRRDPEMIALSSPINATGVFELDPHSDMLAPFEASGVDTQWQLEMPRASNPFDFGTIADVLLTIEYTALHSFDYRQQVIHRLDRAVQADRGFSLRNHFLDQWYDLHHQTPGSTPITVDFRVLAQDFPPNVHDPAIEHLMLVFARADGKKFEVEAGLTFTPAGSATDISVEAQDSVDGVISTRRNGTWASFVGVTPVGTWTLTLPNRTEMIKHFAEEAIHDVLLLVSYRGTLPAWPQ